MTIEEFATQSGIIITRCDSCWGGTYGWASIENPNCTYNGYKTKQAAYKGWLKETFGIMTTRRILKLLTKGVKNGN